MRDARAMSSIERVDAHFTSRYALRRVYAAMLSAPYMRSVCYLLRVMFKYALMARARAYTALPLLPAAAARRRLPAAASCRRADAALPLPIRVFRRCRRAPLPPLMLRVCRLPFDSAMILRATLLMPRYAATIAADAAAYFADYATPPCH